MSASRRHLLTVLLLPVLTLRALLPVGFMAAAEAGELRLVMCAEGLQLPDAPGGSGEHAGDAAPCLFAHSTLGSPPDVPRLVITAADLPLLQSSRGHAVPAATGPPRVDTARAPPSLG